MKAVTWQPLFVNSLLRHPIEIITDTLFNAFCMLQLFQRPFQRTTIWPAPSMSSWTVLDYPPSLCGQLTAPQWRPPFNGVKYCPSSNFHMDWGTSEGTFIIHEIFMPGLFFLAAKIFPKSLKYILTENKTFHFSLLPHQPYLPFSFLICYFASTLL